MGHIFLHKIPKTHKPRFIEQKSSRSKKPGTFYLDNTGSRPLSEVKQDQAKLVLRWGTTLESFVFWFFFVEVPNQQVGEKSAKPSIDRTAAPTEQAYPSSRVNQGEVSASTADGRKNYKVGDILPGDEAGVDLFVCVLFPLPPSLKPLLRCRFTGA